MTKEDENLIIELYNEITAARGPLVRSAAIDSDLLNKLNRELLAIFGFSFEITKDGVNFLDNRKQPAKQVNRQPLKTTEAILKFFGLWILGRLSENNKLFKLAKS